MNRLLYIAPEFAPMNSTGVHRSLKFVKYLSRLNFEITVLTLEESDMNRVFNRPIEPALSEEIEGLCVTHRVEINWKTRKQKYSRILEYFRIFFSVSDSIGSKFLDSSKNWLDINLKKESYEAVIVSLPPFSSYKLVDYLRKASRIPIIVDMRDAWSTWSNSPWPTRLHFLVARWKERNMFKQANKVVTVTKELKVIFENIHPGLLGSKITVIPNGIDFDILQLKDVLTASTIQEKKIIIGYIGSFYYDPDYQKVMSKPWYKRKINHWFLYKPMREDWSYRSPKYLFEILSEMFKEHPELRDKVEFHFVGRIPSWYSEMVVSHELSDIVVNHGFVEYSKIDSLQESFDYVLATSEKVVDGDHYCLPSKVFDYIKASKPILACVTQGSQKMFLEQLGSAYFLDVENIQDSAKQLAELLNTGARFTLNKEFINSFNREVLAKDMREVIQEVI